MTQIEYFKYAIKNRLPLKLEWIYSVFSKPLTDTKYVKIKDNKYFLILDNQEIEVSLSENDVILDIYKEITLTKDDMPIIDNEVKTTIGKALVNYLLFVYPFVNKIKYQNDNFLNIKKIHEQKIITRLSKEDGANVITIDEYNKFGLALTMTRSISELFVISSTEKAILPPPGIDEFKQKKIAEFKNKYGDNVFKDKVKVAELETLLKEYDKEWLKDDPSFGISLSGKILNNSRKKRYLMFGAEDGILPTEDATLVENALLDGYPKDKEELASMFNNSRAGSYSRGKETQESGVISDRLIRGTIGFKVVEDDCKTNVGYKLNVTKSNYLSLVGRYHIVNNKTIEIKNDLEAEKLIDTVINLRGMLYCKTKGNEFCKKCTGKNISRNKNAFTLISLDLGASAMTSNLKKMHDSTLNLYNLSLDDFIK